MNAGFNTGRMSRAALAAVAVAALCLPVSWARGQHGSAPRSSPAARASAPRPQAPKPQQARPQNPVGRPGSPTPGSPTQGRPPVGAPSGARPGYPTPGYPGQANQRPPYPGYPGGAYAGRGYPGNYPPGHLGDWLNQHRNLPVQDQERMLRSDPGFNRLPAQEQQRLVNRLDRKSVV